MAENNGEEELVDPLLRECYDNGEEGKLGLVDLRDSVWVESRKLWKIVGPAIFSRVVSYSMNVITQACAGHLGDLELASMAIANVVLVGFNYALLLGMASALETVCGQAFGAKRYHMLGVYMQRSWIVLFICASLLLPTYVFSTAILEFLGQPSDVAKQVGMISKWLIPLHYSYVFAFPIQRFLQCQLKNSVIAVTTAIALFVHIFFSWLFVYKLKFGLIGISLTLGFSWWVNFLLLFGYVSFGCCPDTWNGFSMEAFAGLWDFAKLSAASGVMICLESWYYRILLLLTGNMENAKIAMDSLSVCMSVNAWQMMIPLAFFTGTGVRVANELGAGNGNGARFATIVSVVTSAVVGIFFCIIVMTLRDKIALIFTSSEVIIKAVKKLSGYLALTILLNSVQPILSGVAVGSGWQATVAYVNIGTYYLIGVPVGVLLGWFFNLGVLGIWGGMIGGTAVQTLILAFMTVRSDWDKEAMKASTRMENIDVLK